MLVGNRPFTGTTPLQIAIRHVEEEVPPLSPEVPRPLAELVMRALDKDATKRPATAAVFDDELDACAKLLAPGPEARVIEIYASGVSLPTAGTSPEARRPRSQEE